MVDIVNLVSEVVSYNPRKQAKWMAVDSNTVNGDANKKEEEDGVRMDQKNCGMRLIIRSMGLTKNKSAKKVGSIWSRGTS